jgi:hypothetical protein
MRPAFLRPSGGISTTKMWGEGGKGEAVAAWVTFSCYLFLAYQLLDRRLSLLGGDHLRTAIAARHRGGLLLVRAPIRSLVVSETQQLGIMDAK